MTRSTTLAAAADFGAAPTKPSIAIPDRWLKAEEAASELNIALPTLWREVAGGRLPAPCYPAARAPRWRRSELLAAVEATRAKPADAMASRRAAKLSAQRISETAPGPPPPSGRSSRVQHSSA